MPTKQRFDEKDPTEKLVLSYDFSQGLSATETLVGTPTVTIVVNYSLLPAGDPNPNAILNGPIAFDATNRIVYIPIQGGVDGVDYDIAVECQTSNPKKVFVVACILPVRTQ